MSLFLQCYPGDAVVEFVGRLMLGISFVIGFAAILAFVAMRRRPALRHALWLGVLVWVVFAPLMLLVVERAGWVWSIQRPSGLPTTSSMVLPSTAPIHAGVTLDFSRPSSAPTLASDVVQERARRITTASQSRARASHVAEPLARSAVDMWRSLASCAILLWLAGAIFLLVRLFRGSRQVRRLLLEVQTIPAGFLQKPLEIVIGTLGVIRLPAFATSPALAGPVVAGLIRPTVVLPTEFVSRVGTRQLADILIHECAHALRHDTWTGLIQRFVQVALWPHPLIYLMNRSLSRAREEVCDNYVLRHGDAIGYAQTLLELARDYSQRTTPEAALAVFTAHWKLEDRVAGLLDPYRQRGTRVGWSKFLLLLAMMLAGGSALAGAHFDDREPKKGAATTEKTVLVHSAPRLSPASEKIAQALDEPTTVEFREKPLGEALRSIGSSHNIIVVLEKEALQAENVDLDQPVTLKLSGLSLRFVLKLLLEPMALGIYLDEGELVVTTGARAAANLDAFSYSLKEELAAVDRAGIPLADLAETITAVIDPASWKKNGGEGELRVEQEGLRIRQRSEVRDHLDDLLRELLTALDPQIAAQENRLQTRGHWIGDLHDVGLADADILRMLDESLLAEDRRKKAVTIEDGRLVMTQPAWIHSAATDLFRAVRIFCESDQMLDYARDWSMRSEWMLPIEPRRRVIGERLRQQVPVDFLDLPLDECLKFIMESSKALILMRHEEIELAGIDRHSPVTLNTETESLSSLLDRMLAPSKLDWYVLDPDCIVVTTRSRAARRMEPRVYRTRELLTAGLTEKALMPRIAAIEPGSWAERGGSGKMRLLPGVLIVANNRRVHDQIGQMLTSLKAGREQPSR